MIITIIITISLIITKITIYKLISRITLQLIYDLVSSFDYYELHLVHLLPLQAIVLNKYMFVVILLHHHDIDHKHDKHHMVYLSNNLVDELELKPKRLI